MPSTAESSCPRPLSLRPIDSGRRGPASTAGAAQRLACTSGGTGHRGAPALPRLLRDGHVLTLARSQHGAHPSSRTSRLESHGATPLPDQVPAGSPSPGHRVPGPSCGGFPLRKRGPLGQGCSWRWGVLSGVWVSSPAQAGLVLCLQRGGRADRAGKGWGRLLPGAPGRQGWRWAERREVPCPASVGWWRPKAPCSFCLPWTSA